MRKTPSYLKGLAETRARVAAEVQRYQRLQGEINLALDNARAELGACDRLIRKFDERLNPELIQPIKATKGRYGPRGKMKEAIIGLLKENYPEEATTTEIGLRLQVAFGLDFFTQRERFEWIHNSVARQVKKLVYAGLVERLHDPLARNMEDGRWRWKGGGRESLGGLEALAESSGVSVHRTVEPYTAEGEPATDDLPV